LAVVVVVITMAAPLLSAEKPVGQAAAGVLKEAPWVAAVRARSVKAIPEAQVVIVQAQAAAAARGLVEIVEVGVVLAAQAVPDFHPQ
jgi:hypothetical protein